ncbi:Tyrosine recombinase XerD [subsurface metagenome]
MGKKTNQDLMAEFVSSNGVILEKKLFKHLYGDKPKGRVKPGVIPSKQTPGLYRTRNDAGKLADQVMSFFKKNTSEPDYVKAIIELLFLYGLRISEAIAITHIDISAAGVIRVKGQKGSNDRFVRPISYSHLWAFIRDCQVSYQGVYSRQYFYRLLKKYGFFSYYGGNVNMSVTHMFRHEFARDLMSCFREIETVQKGLGQKSKKSTEYYVGGSKKKK